MIFSEIQEFKKQIIKNTRIIAVDFGVKRIGIAISDKDLQMAFSKTMIPRKTNKQTIQSIRQIISENSVSAVIFGLPLNNQEEETNFCKSIKNFVREMLNVFDIPVFFCNEYLTSKSAEIILLDELKQNLSNTKKYVDKVAAAIILQDFITHISK
jgi:putative Holliday junction resolvase